MHLWMHPTKPELLGVCSKHEFSQPCLEFWCVYDSYYLHFYITELETYNWLWFEGTLQRCIVVTSLVSQQQLRVVSIRDLFSNIFSQQTS